MKTKAKLIRLVLFAMYGAVMFVTKLVMEPFYNIHPLTMFIMTFTVVYGPRALIPTYVYVFLNGLFSGFGLWWYPYLYVWAIQCLVTLFVPKRIPDRAAAIVYPLLGAVFGITFGALYSPVQALMFHFSFETTVKWVITGLPADALHALGNFFICMLVLPLSKLLKKLHESSGIPAR